MCPRIQTALLSLSFLLTGCLGNLPFDRALRLEGIQDVPGSEDLVIVDMSKVEGRLPGLYAMKLPADWKSRPAESRVNGFPVLVPAIDPEWKPLEAAIQEWQAPRFDRRDRIPWQFIRGELTLEQASEIAFGRQKEGKDTYWVGAIEEHGDPATWTCELLGARWKEPNGDLDAQPGASAIEWVQLGHLEFVDSRSGQDRKLQRTFNELGAGAALAVLVGGPLLLWIVWLS